jgi:ribosomal protein L7Ae-like RNA K-turn-binding protein
MIRLVLGDDGGLGVDLRGRAFGRGAWVHPRVDCLSRAVTGGVDRSFRRHVATDARVLFADVRAAADRRVEALVASARRAGHAAAGSDVSEAAVREGRAAILVVAADARAAAQASFVMQAAGAGKAVVWGTKEQLGRATGRPDTAVVAILDRGLADAVVRAAALSKIPDPGAGREMNAVVEVR